MDGGTEPRRKGIGRKTVSAARRFGQIIRRLGTAFCPISRRNIVADRPQTIGFNLTDSP
jgi:hypothetical protein